MTYADNAPVVVTIPKEVIENQKFQIAFSIKNVIPDSFSLPKIKHVSLISGPYKRTNTTPVISGGRIKYLTTTSLVYVAVADKKGKYSIPQASMWSRGNIYKSYQVELSVISQADQQKRIDVEKKKSEQVKSQIPEASLNDLTAEDVFVKTELEKNDVVENEHNSLILKLYYRVNVSGWDDLHLPKAKHCDYVQASLSNASRYGKAVVNGRTYNTYILDKLDFVPSKKETISFDNGDVTIYLNVLNKNDFWGSSHKVRKNLIIPGVSFDVKESKKASEPQPETEMPHWNL